MNKKLQGKTVNITPFTPRKHQKKAIKDAVKHFVQDDESRGKLIFEAKFTWLYTPDPHY